MKTFKVPAPIQHKRRRIKFILTGFILWTGLTFAYLGYLALNQSNAIRRASNEFYTLHAVYQKGGIGAFLSNKKILKERITKAMKKRGSNRSALAATNIATYLFPSLLPETNFEKQVALEQWTPMQKAIESAPHTRESREHFQEMRANIWNYENPDRQSPSLSKPATQVIRIYDSLSKYSKE